MDPLTADHMIEIRPADPTTPDIQAIITAHLEHSWAATPETSCHTMTVDEMAKEPGLRFWALYDGKQALGCGALKPLPDGTVEVKSVHVVEAARGRGFARKIMEYLEREARAAGHAALVLETGSDVLPAYDAARALYERVGFVAGETHSLGPLRHVFGFR